jgi:uncharacterized membrane protein YhaH (DUF805 family)
MRKIIFTTMILVIMILSSCVENATDAALQKTNEAIHISGALNTKFESSQSTLNEDSTQNSKHLYFSIHGTTNKNNFWQFTSFNFAIILDRSKDLRSGNIFEISETTSLNKMSYQSKWDETTFTDLQFEIDGGEILFDKIDDERISGRFTLWAHQLAGRRMTHGQVEDLILSNQGEITVTGIFTSQNK